MQAQHIDLQQITCFNYNVSLRESAAAPMRYEVSDSCCVIRFHISGFSVGVPFFTSFSSSTNPVNVESFPEPLVNIMWLKIQKLIKELASF